MNRPIPTSPGKALRPGAFTLLELLLVIAVIAILAALLLPVVSMMRGRADSAACLSQLRQIGMGINGYMNDHESMVPGPLDLTQGATYQANQAGSLAAMLESYLSPANANGAAGTNRFSAVFSCPAAARQLNDPTKPTYLMNMLVIPFYGQSPWGDINAAQKPLTKASLTNWTDASDLGIPLDLSAMWAMQDGDQDYVLNHTNFFTGSVANLLPKPAHVDHYNALFFDFHVAPRQAGLQIVEPGSGSSSSSGSNSSGNDNNQNNQNNQSNPSKP